MPRLITVPASVDSSQKFQTLINNTGNVPTEFVFSEDRNIEVSSPIRFYPAVKLVGNGATFRLKDRVSTSTFPSMTPILGAKNSGVAGFEFSGLVFDGNSDNQTTTLGRGFHNFIGLSKASDILIHDCYIHDSMGDGARLTDVNNVLWSNNRICRCGHDALYVDKGSNIEACNNYTELRTNSAIRFRHVQNGYAHDNFVINKVQGKASCPGIQIENSTTGMASRNIVIETNEIRDTWGPGIWIVGLSNTSIFAASGLSIKNNLFVNCGNMDGDYHHIPGVGGIVADGWNDLDISYNTFDRCMGYGVAFGPYVSATPSGEGYNAKVYRNIFTDTRKANTEGTASGMSVAKLTSRYSSVIISENCFWNNIHDPVGETVTGSIFANPLYVSPSDYHLQANSPCRFAGYQLGRYNGTEFPALPDKPAFLMFECPESKLSVIKTTYPEWKILRKNDVSE